MPGPGFLLQPEPLAAGGNAGHPIGAHPSEPGEPAEPAEEEWDPEAEVLRLYGENWMQNHGVQFSTEAFCPGIEEGWMICTLCHKQLAGLCTVLSHFESKGHQMWLAYRNQQVLGGQMQGTGLALPAPAGWKADQGWVVQPRVGLPPPPPTNEPPPPPPPPPEGGEQMSYTGWVTMPPPPPLGQPPSIAGSYAPTGLPPSMPHAVPAAGMGSPDQGALFRADGQAPTELGRAQLGSLAPAHPGPPSIAEHPAQAQAVLGPTSAPAHGAAVLGPTSAPASATRSAEAIAVLPYEAKEVAEDGRPESGYLILEVGDRVVLHGAPVPGHSANRALHYSYGRKLGPTGESGWFPSEIVRAEA